MYVIGTAGHVDHGKSALVRVLTGIDPDRLREEKERGLTIDLGFAWLTLPSGREVSIVDVPGHERFIKNMLAGAGGVDLALLVVAADEGPMPQTREHLAILDLLDVPAGVVALTKCDLVDEEYAALVEAEVDDVLSGSRLAGAPRVRVSALSGEGLAALLAAIDAALDATPPKRNLGRPRLPIDRAFTAQGFGAVVTGTLIDGGLEVGQEVEFQPGGLRARIRGLQRHRSKVQRLEPGTRAAVNLSGIRAEDLRRGMVLSLPGSLRPVTAVDVLLRAPTMLTHPLAHDSGVTFLSATSESEGKVRLLDRDELPPGQEAWAQVVLASPVAVAARDHCILRTPNETVAGGRIVSVNPPRRRRFHAPVLQALARQLQGSPSERLADLLASGPLDRAAVTGALALEPADAEQAVAEALSAGVCTRAGERLYSTAWLDASGARALEAVQEFLRVNALRAAAPREHVRSSARLDAATFDAVVARALGAGRLEERTGGGLAPRGYRVALSPTQEAEVGRFLAALKAGGFSPPTENLPAPAVLAYLVEQGLAVDSGAGVFFDAGVFQAMVERVRAHIIQHGSLSLAEARDLFGTSRKYAQAFLEHLDARRVTRREGDVRVLREPAEVTR
ncbi:MAG: selenocysteine-specific translation elongation factor [Dehalococcoidia bacterium]|nr:selenocysteine-specific translation elongation factor [Dehalococcoidia bacterium]RIL04030.1 MAG: selenocysteine-specific translation elongation factor [bacterium]